MKTVVFFSSDVERWFTIHVVLNTTTGPASFPPQTANSEILSLLWRPIAADQNRRITPSPPSLPPTHLYRTAVDGIRRWTTRSIYHADHRCPERCIVRGPNAGNAGPGSVEVISGTAYVFTEANLFMAGLDEIHLLKPSWAPKTLPKATFE